MLFKPHLVVFDRHDDAGRPIHFGHKTIGQTTQLLHQTMYVHPVVGRPAGLWQHVVDHVDAATLQLLPSELEVVVFARHGIGENQVEPFAAARPFEIGEAVADNKMEPRIFPEMLTGDGNRFWIVVDGDEHTERPQPVEQPRRAETGAGAQLKHKPIWAGGRQRAQQIADQNVGALGKAERFRIGVDGRKLGRQMAHELVDHRHIVANAQGAALDDPCVDAA